MTQVGSNKDFKEGFPNGIALSPDEKHLYVTIGRKIMRYEVQADDTVANPTEFLDVEGNDGMKVDANGNVFSTTGAGPARCASRRPTASVSDRCGSRSRPANRATRFARPTSDSATQTARVCTSPPARTSITSG